MHYLYGIKGDSLKLVATFDSEQQLLAYLRWATLSHFSGQPPKFEQGSVLTGYRDSFHAQTPSTTDAAANVPHNPSPSML